MSINKTRKIEEASKRINVPVIINGRIANALMDTGSTLTHISENLSKLLKLDFMFSSEKLNLATNNSYLKSLGTCLKSSKFRASGSRIQKRSRYFSKNFYNRRYLEEIHNKTLKHQHSF